MSTLLIIMFTPLALVIGVVIVAAAYGVIDSLLTKYVGS